MLIQSPRFTIPSMSGMLKNSPCENSLAKYLGRSAQKSEFASAHYHPTIRGNGDPISRARNTYSAGHHRSSSRKESKERSIILQSDMITISGRWFKLRIPNNIFQQH